MPDFTMYMRWGKLYKGGSTGAEHSLEPAVAAIGLAYRTQFPGFLFGFRFFPDFFIPQLNLIIEVDGDEHRDPDKVIADAERTEELGRRGYRVVRCTNEKALSDPHGTVRALLSEAGITPRDIDAAKRRPFAGCLPQPKKAPQKVKRAAVQAETKRRRASSRSRQPEPARTSTLSTPPTPPSPPPSTSSP